MDNLGTTNTNRWGGLLLSGVALCWLGTANAQAERRYLVTDLGTLTERSSAGVDINERSEVVGSAAMTGGCWVLPDGSIVGEAWTAHAFVSSGGVMTDLGVLEPDQPPGVFPRPAAGGCAINNSGQAAGIYEAMSGWPWAFVWLPEPAWGQPAGMSALPMLSDYDFARAFSINDRGQIVGEARPDLGVSVRAVLWEVVDGAWQVQDLGSLDGLPDSTSRAYDINALGQIVGQSNNIGVHLGLEMFLWLPEPAYGLPAGMSSIDTFLHSGEGVAINDLGQIAGQTGPMNPWLWLPEPAYGLPAGQNLIGEFPIDNVEHTLVKDINNLGQIVGKVRYRDAAGFVQNGGWIWENGVYTLLDDLLPPAGEWDGVLSAYGINDLGQITGEVVGDFWYQGLRMPHAMILGPVTLGDLDGDDDVDLADLAQLLANYRTTGATYDEGDLDGDGDVDLSDLAELLAHYGETP